jgi:uncharacterized protein YbcI
LFAASFLPARETNLLRETRTQAVMARQHDSHQPRLEGGALNAAISETLVRLLAESTGRGPTKARTTIDRDLIVVVLQNSLTPGERYLADDHRTEQVLDMRRAYQDAISSDCIASIEDLTGRTVLAFMSANHIDPDLAAEVFILKPETNTPHSTVHADR